SEDFSHLSCTIDNSDDYRRVVKLFENIPNPREIGWLELTRKLAALPDHAQLQVRGPETPGLLRRRFVLGTAQLGMKYGRVNRTGKPRKQSAIEILRYAI